MHRMVLFFLLVLSYSASAQVSVASKTFPESTLLAEIMAQCIEAKTGLDVERRFGLGGTLICYQALQTGEIQVYPEYTGTIRSAILNEVEGISEMSRNELSNLLYKRSGITMGKNLGFNNTYVLVGREELQAESISGLKNRNDLKYGFSNEFINRQDGFPGLTESYGMDISTPRGLDHGLAYKALEAGQIDVTDAYSTDGRLKKFNFKYLEDDRGFFPEYQALPLIKSDAYEAELIEALSALDGLIDEKTMQALNYRYEVEGESVERIASDFLMESGISKGKNREKKWHPIITQTLEHLQLSFIGTLLATLLAIPLGIWITGKKRLSSSVLAITGTIQTIPSLALLGFMIPLFGIGFVPAIIALFLYALLPIVRNTYTGLQETDPVLLEAAKAMGMTDKQTLFKLRLPLAVNVIMAGVRTALTINIGTATLAAFIGAGGLGESIITGINLNNNELILQGAIPAALLALIMDRLMLLLQNRITPKGIVN